MKEVLKDMDRITVLDDDNDDTKGGANKSNIPHTKGSVGTPDFVDNIPSCSNARDNTELMVTPNTSTSSYHDIVTNKSDNVRSGDTPNVTTTTESNISSSSVTQTKKLPTILSNREIYENIDNIPRPSYWLPETEPDKKEEEIDDFEYLGMLDDGYLLSLFDEDKEEPSSEEPTQTPAHTEDIVTQEGEVGSTVQQTAAEDKRRSNPPRRAKEGVVYRDDYNQLEEVLQSEYCELE